MSSSTPEIPAEAVEAAAKAFFLSTRDNEIPQAWDEDERGVVVDDDTKDAYRDAVHPGLQAAYPHLLAAFAKQLEAMVESRELNSHDCGWVVPTTDLESFLERLEDTSEGTD
jgi:uncharacterized protein (DUF1800 family)